jgi:GT2 family glycosyltransferase
VFRGDDTVWPKVSIIWVNYNSIAQFPIVLESLESIAELDYPFERYELIVVDNGSTDGSYEEISKFLEKKNNLHKKIIRLQKNLGFTGGNNVGFRARDKESKYVLLLNNDAVLFQEGLKKLVEIFENLGKVAGVQGVVLKYKSGLIDTAGGYINEFLQPYLLGQGYPYKWRTIKYLPVTYVDGSCALYRVKNILECVGNKLFLDEFFAYYDDTLLGLMMWNCGYKLIAVPEPIAYHVRNLTFRREKGFLLSYLTMRNRIALTFISNTRYKDIILLHALRSSIVSLLKGRDKGLEKARIRALYDGIKLGKRMRKRGIFLDIYKAPLIKMSLKDVGVVFTQGTKKYTENLKKTFASTV